MASAACLKCLQSLVAFSCWEEIVETGDQSRKDGLANAVEKICFSDNDKIESKIKAFMEGRGRFQHILEGDNLAGVFGHPIANTSKGALGRDGNEDFPPKENIDIILLR
jgi:hypothetical protein